MLDQISDQKWHHNFQSDVCSKEISSVWRQRSCSRPCSRSGEWRGQRQASHWQGKLKPSCRKRPRRDAEESLQRRWSLWGCGEPVDIVGKRRKQETQNYKIQVMGWSTTGKHFCNCCHLYLGIWNEKSNRDPVEENNKIFRAVWDAKKQENLK